MQYFIEYGSLPLLLKASWQAGVIILLVLAAQWALGRRLSPRWRYALWLLVVIRLALPWTIPSTVSLFNFLSWGRASQAAVSPPAIPSRSPVFQATVSAPVEVPMQQAAAAPQLNLNLSWVPLAWAAGAFVMALFVVITHYRIWRRVTPCRPLIDSRVLNLLEDCKQRMGVRVPVVLVETAAVEGPCLFGFLRPRLLLPPGFTRSFSIDELRHVFLHELGHVKRHDILLGWMMTLLQILHWFNPLVWLAFGRMRMDRELACDALALSYAKEQDQKPYGRTIVKLLENFGDTLRAPSLAGIIEDHQQMKQRILMIAQFNKSNGGFAVAASLLAVLGLITLTDAQTADPSTPQLPNRAPRIVRTSPKVGAKDVDPALTEITVTFDRDMERGFSWTGSGPKFPVIPQGAKPYWRDSRTCVLAVELKSGHDYRVGINSMSYHGFTGTNGLPTAISAIYFTTSGLKMAMKTPEIVRLDPPNGATDVSPAVAELRVTFNIPMGGGMSWCGGGPNYPTTPEGQKAYWTDDGKTCVLPVQLKPGLEYRLGLNSRSFKNFQSDDGMPLVPVDYTFKTSDK